MPCNAAATSGERAAFCAAANCAIIIDDVEDRIYIHPTARGLRIQQKHRLSHLLVDAFARHGLLERREALGQTGWYAMGPARLPAEEIERLALGAYRQLVVTTVTLSDATLKWRLYRWLDQHLPSLLRAYKWVRRRAAGGEAMAPTPRGAR